MWSLLALYVVAMATIHVPAVQRSLGSRVGALLGDKLGTEVRVGQIDLGFFNRLIIDDVAMLDQKGKEALRVGRLSAKIDLVALAEGRIGISTAQLFGAHATLYRPTASAPLNIQFVIDSLASKDTTKAHTPLDLQINSLIIRNSSVAYDQWDVAPTNGRLNTAHLNVHDISAHIILKALTDDSINVNVKRLAAKELSGIDVSQLSFKLEAGRHGSQLRAFTMQLPRSALRMDSVLATYDRGNFKQSLAFVGAVDDTRIAPADLAALLPQLRTLDEQLSITARFAGTATSLQMSQLAVASSLHDFALSASGQASQLGTPSPIWLADIAQLSATSAAVERIGGAFTKLPEAVARIGDVTLSGKFAGNRNELTTSSTLGTSVGTVALRGRMDAAKRFSAHLDTKGVDMQRLLGDDRFGTLATNIDVSGRLAGSTVADVSAKGRVDDFDYKGYHYSNAELNGTYSPDNVAGTLSIGDPNLTARLEGQLAKTKVRLQGRIERLAPGALKLSERWGDAEFCADVDADFTATSINDAQGAVSLRNLVMRQPDGAAESYRLNYLRLESGYDEGRHFVTLNSDFAHADLTGRFDYATLAQSLTDFVGSKLPTLPGLPQQGGLRKRGDNDFRLSLTMLKADWLRQLLGVDVALSQPLWLSRHVTMAADIPAFTYNGGRYQGGRIDVTSPGDSIVCGATLTKLMADGRKLDLKLHADAANNNISTQLEWADRDNANDMSGQLNAVGHLYRNLDNQPEAHVRIMPSTVKVNQAAWTVEPSDILYSEDRLLVDHFNIRHADQHMLVDGVASRSHADSLFIDLNQVDVGYVLNLVNFHAVEFSGDATGHAYVAGAFDEPSAQGRLRVDNFLFEHGRMGTLTAGVNWNRERQQIDIDAVANDGPDALTLIRGYVSPPRDYIDLGITAQGTHLDFMHSFTKSFVSSITGQAEGDLRLFGPLSTINLTGRLVVDGEASITPLGTTYTMHRDTVIMEPDEIELHQMEIRDRHQNSGTLSGYVHHKHLTQLSYDLHVEAGNLLSYDFPDFGDQVFYGTVYASGNVDIHGRSGEVVIDCDVTPQKKSVFVYNAANPDAISNQEFITWRDKLQPATADAPQGAPRPDDHSPFTDIFLNFRINTTPDGTLRLLMDAATGDYITLAGSGTLRATFHNKGAFQMFGTYTVDHGTYDITIQNIIKKNFQFQPGGTIVFGGDPYDAALALQALYTVNGVSLSDLQIGNSFSSNTVRVNCLMNIGGQANAPQVDFDLDLPTVNADELQMIRTVLAGEQETNQQVLYLLGVGRFYNQGQNNADANQADQTSLAMQSFLSGTLSTQINTVLNQVIKNDNWNFGANISTGTEGWNNAEYEGTVSGRMLNNRLLVNGQFGYRDNATQAAPSFIGDFDIRYLLQPSGNLALKVYNQTNDRYFTRSALNTQGIGLIMKRDFNGLGDLFAPSRRRAPSPQKAP